MENNMGTADLHHGSIYDSVFLLLSLSCNRILVYKIIVYLMIYFDISN